MFDPKWVRDHPEALDAGLIRRGWDEPERKQVLDRLRALDAERRAVIAKLQALQERRNAASKEVGAAKQAKDEERASALIAEVAKLKDDLAKLEAEQRVADEKLDAALAELPNVPAADVPPGRDSSANVERHRYGEPKKYAFKPKQHFELGEALGLMDFETAAKFSGARFVVLKGGLARLERALAQFMLDLHTGEHGYAEVNPPVLVRDEAMIGTAQLPKFQYDQFVASRISVRGDLLHEALKDIDATFEKKGRQGSIAALIDELLEAAPTKEDFWLIPTAEVPLTNLVRESIIEESALPLRYTACTPCFRAEAGAAGKDTRGMMRQHQFTKVELVSITTPEQSAAEHERMLACAEAVLKKLDLPFRTVTLCTGDMGFAAQKTYDIEVWLPGEGAYREISSCSNCGEFQARRMDARYRPKGGKGVRHVHTLNGSGVAVGRALIAVLENYQDEGGAIAVPDALKPYMNGLSRIEKN
jgi:seryl-tRNA synthetase